MSDLQLQQLQQAKATIEGMKEKAFDIKDIRETEHHIEIYTGFQSYGVFQFLISNIRPKLQKLQCFKGKRSQTIKSY